MYVVPKVKNCPFSRMGKYFCSFLRMRSALPVCANEQYFLRIRVNRQASDPFLRMGKIFLPIRKNLFAHFCEWTTFSCSFARMGKFFAHSQKWAISHFGHDISIESKFFACYNAKNRFQKFLFYHELFEFLNGRRTTAVGRTVQYKPQKMQRGRFSERKRKAFPGRGGGKWGVHSKNTCVNTDPGKNLCLW